MDLLNNTWSQIIVFDTKSSSGNSNSGRFQNKIYLHTSYPYDPVWLALSIQTFTVFFWKSLSELQRIKEIIKSNIIYCKNILFFTWTMLRVGLPKTENVKPSYSLIVQWKIFTYPNVILEYFWKKDWATTVGVN